MQNFRTVVRLFLGTALVASVPVSQAFAGFEWTPPATQQVSPPMMAVPTPEVNSEVLPSIMPQELPTIEEAVVAPAPVTAEPVQQFPNKEFEVVQGFGSDIPLVLVMNQVVPSEYSYSFDDTVDQGMRVSWNGGKPWNIVLKEALNQHGYGIVISNDVVWVRDEIYPVEVAAPRMPTGMHIIDNTQPVDMTGTTMAPPAPSMPGETLAPLNEEPAPKTMPAPVAMETEAPRTANGDNYTPSYPRRVPPQIDRSVAMAADMPVTQPQPVVAAPKEVEPAEEDMPMSLMPFKKADPLPAPQTQQEAQLPVITAVPATAAVNAPAMDSDAAKGPVLDPFEIHYWKAVQGEKLRTVLRRWSDEANVALIWNAAYDYELPSDIAMHGTFPDVISQTLMTFSNTEPRPLGKLHPNLPSGPSVLTVETFSMATN